MRGFHHCAVHEAATVTKTTFETRALQACVALAAIVPVAAGAWGVFAIPEGASLGELSHRRYLSGLLLAIGLAFWSIVPGIERKSGAIRLLAGLVVIGGLCRLLGVAMGDPVTWTVAGALVMELLVTPSLCLWQRRVSEQSPLAS